MIKQLFFLILTFFTVNLACGCGKVVKTYHGSANYEELNPIEKIKKFIKGQTTKEEIIKLLGPASFVDPLLPNVYVYVRYEKNKKNIGPISINNIKILILKFNKNSVLIDKQYYMLDKSVKIKRSKEETNYNRAERYNLLSQLGRDLLKSYSL